MNNKTEFKYIGKSYSHVDSKLKVSGQLEYISDIRMPGMLWGKVVRSPYPHARIVSVDKTLAERVPGVKAVLIPSDVPYFPSGPFVPDWEILPRNKVRNVGQEVAAIAATTPEAAAEAAELLKIEYEILPAVFDPEEAIKPDAPLLYEEKGTNICTAFHVERGNVEEGFAKSKFIREETFKTSVQFHAFLEPQGCIAKYDPISDSYTLWAATQSPYKARLVYAQAMGIDFSKIRLIQAPMGGGFGGKFEIIMHVLALFLSKKAGGAVRLVDDLDETFYTTPLRVPMKITTKVGIDKEGYLMAKKTYVIADNGSRTSSATGAFGAGCYRQDNMYRFKNVCNDGHLLYTNNVTKGAMRGFGNPEGIFALESILDQLAEDIGMDPGELRKRNSLNNGEVSVHGWHIGSCGLNECIDKAKNLSNWKERTAPTAKKDKVRRGLGLACAFHVAGNRSMLKEFGGSSMIIKLGPDGIFRVSTGDVELGQGYKTVVSQYVAEVLNIPLSWIEIMLPDSTHGVLGIGSLASRATVASGAAAIKAANNLKQHMMNAFAEYYSKDAADLVIEDEKLFDKKENKLIAGLKEAIRHVTDVINGGHIIGVGDHTPNTVLPDKDNYGNISPVYPFATDIADVEVDMETGKIKILNYTSVNDVGRAINPMLCMGQIEGANVQGIGWALIEDVIVNGKGQIANNNFADYKLYTFEDMPNMVGDLVEENDPNGPYGAKSLGELALDPVVATIGNAIYNAIGVRLTELPFTPEKVLAAIKEKESGLNDK